MTAQEFQAANLERAGQAFALFIESTEADKHHWTPEVSGAAGLRSVLEQAAECVMINTYFGLLVSGQPVPEGGPRAQTPVVFTDGPEAQAAIQKSAQELAAIVRSLPDETFSKEFVTSRGAMSGDRAIDLPYRHMWYHIGQINQLQLLYGDTTLHGFPPPPPKP